MDPLTEKDIATLLRLKRYEQPPPGYFEDFLQEFHRRQRAELLRQPAWKMALQRVRDFMFELSVPQLSSGPAMATAVVLFAAVLTFKVVQTPNEQSTNVAANTATVEARDAGWSLAQPVTTRDIGPTPFRMTTDNAAVRRVTTTPRYVLDSTPVSYEVALRF